MRKLLPIALALLISDPALAYRHPANIARTQPVFNPAAQIAYQYQPKRKVRRHHAHTLSKRHVRHKAAKHYSVYKNKPIGNQITRKPSPVEIIVDGVAGFVGAAVHALVSVGDVTVRRPKRLTGSLEIEGRKFDYVSGGAGWSIPYGHFPITPEAVGPWGRRHGAIGLNDDTIHDKQLGRDREGIEIHASRSATAGCLGIRDGYTRFKKMVLAMIEQNGHAWLHVGPKGAKITPTKQIVLASE